MPYKHLRQSLSKDYWLDANLKLLAKILVEFMYENLIVTEVKQIDTHKYEHILNLDSQIRYTFIASPRIFENWNIDVSSIKYYTNMRVIDELLVSDFIVNAYKLIGVDELTLGHFLRELNHTLLADCHLLSNDKNDNSYLLALPDFSHLEGFMHGHPWFVINKGRLGFSYTEYLNYAPEMRSLQQLSWIAVSKKCASFNAVNELDYQKLILSELSTPDLEYFSLLLKSLDLEPDGFYLMPVHEWQWQRQIIQLFTDDIARCDIIYLGYGSDHYLATQSIRSFNNQSHKTKFQVKLPMSIFNTAVYRGLPNRRTELAPLLSQWIKNTVALDSVFKSQRLIMLSEAASINYSHKIYTDIPGVPYQYKELLGVIWRENLNNYLTEQERAITMASLIHIDNNQRPFIQDLINKSPLDISKWLEQFFRVCIPPLLHWLYKYKVVFSPHGENTMLVLDENYCPSRLVLKDFIDDVNITDCDMSTLSDMPVELLDTLYRLPDNELSQFIHTGLFVVLYRYLSDILYSYCDYPEDKFWQQVYNVIVEYHNEHPELSEAIASINILQPMFKKLNLNRLRLLEVGYADYANRPKVESTILMYNPANQDNWQSWSKSMSI